MPDPKPVIAYLFTTFPQSTETFLQREIIAMRELGVNMRLYSLWGGGGLFRGMKVHRFPKWKLFTLVWMIPYLWCRHPDVLNEVARGLFTRRAPSWINFWENMLGAGFGGLYASHFRKLAPAHIHAAWSGGPATAAWFLLRMNGQKFICGAHAYDIYEHGGDWWLKEKIVHAQFIHTSTDMARFTLIERGIAAEKIHTIRRGLDQFPRLKRLRASRDPVRLLCVARLVEKKGLRHQMKIYAALRQAGVSFEAQIVGEGPLRAELERFAGQLGVAENVIFTGHLAQHEVWNRFEWADALLHTGIVAESGDRDGLPNVIPEAMAAGVVVVSSPAAATTEAILDGETGLVATVEDAPAWVHAIRCVALDDGLADRLRRGARLWVEENFDAHRNAGRLLAHFETLVGNKNLRSAGPVGNVP